MARLAITLLIICSMVVAMPAVHGVEKDPQAVEQWFQNITQKKEKLTKLHFYFHDVQSGKNQSAMQVARPDPSSNPPASFGPVWVLDDALTEGPEPNSTVVGRAQGMYANTAMQELSLLMTMNFYFTSGDYNGSTLSVLGRNPILDLYREMPVVGGSGVFRLARGIATAKSYSINMTSGNAIVEYNVVVSHYE